MRGQIKRLLSLMKQEPSLQHALPETRESIVRTFRWMACSELLMVLSAVPIKYFIEEVTLGSEGNIMHYAYVALAMMIIGWAVARSQSKMGINRNDVFWRSWRIWWSYGNRCILRQSARWHTQNGTGEKESIVGKNITRFQTMFDELLFNTTPAALRIVYTCVFMTWIRWEFGLFMISVVVGFLLVLRYTEKLLFKSREAFQNRIKEVEKYGSEINGLAMLIRSLGMEEVFADRNDTLLDRFARDETPRHRLYEKCMRLQAHVITHSKATFVLLVGVMICYRGDTSITPALLAMVMDWKGRAESNFGRFGDLQHHLGRGKESLRELVEFSLLEPEVTNSPDPRWPAEAKGSVTLNNVTFTHAGADEPTICSYNLHVPAYSSVALVGMSGSGKSTIMKLVERWYDPDDGVITVDDVPLPDIDYGRYRHELIAVVSQDVRLAECTIADNIRLARPDASYEEVISAATASGAHDFIMDLKGGYEAPVGENGVNLSGGQKQRIAIARALIMNPTILMLDEATSALDAMSQAEVQKTINDLMRRKKCTIFIVAHRLSTVRSADQIVVMDKGKIIDIGKHVELLSRCAIYQRMNELENQ